MFILALDTSASYVSVAVLDDEKTLACKEEQMERGQAEALIPFVQEVLAQSNLKATDLQAIAVSVGPGSFTGVRIGLACAKALSLALSIPAWGVKCFEAWKEGIVEPCVVALDSKREDYYTQFFGKELTVLSEPQIMSNEQLKEKLPFSVVGTGAKELESSIGARYLEKAQPIAVSIGQIAFKRKENPLPASPLYMRQADVSI